MKTQTGKISLIDLAGSERLAKTGASKKQQLEAKSINQSLSALGNVISAISTKSDFIPYRSNKLTQLMEDSIGGNAKTLMFVNVSPVDYKHRLGIHFFDAHRAYPYVDAFRRSKK